MIPQPHTLGFALRGPATLLPARWLVLVTASAEAARDETYPRRTRSLTLEEHLS